MTDDLLKIVTALADDVKKLKIQAQATDQLLIGITAGLANSGAISMKEVVATADVVQLIARHSEGDEVANAMQFVIDSLRSLNDVPKPIDVLVSRLIVSTAAGKALQQPLQHWLAQAQPDEIGEDLRRALQQLFSSSGDPQDS